MMPINLTTNTAFTEYWGEKSYKTQVWVQMMADAFKAVDHERDALTTGGSWTSKTGNIQSYARVDLYA